MRESEVPKEHVQQISSWWSELLTMTVWVKSILPLVHTWRVCHRKTIHTYDPFKVTTVGGGRSTQTGPIRTLEEHGNSTHTALAGPAVCSANRCTSVPPCIDEMVLMLNMIETITQKMKVSIFWETVCVFLARVIFLLGTGGKMRVAWLSMSVR